MVGGRSEILLGFGLFSGANLLWMFQGGYDSLESWGFLMISGWISAKLAMWSAWLTDVTDEEKLSFFAVVGYVNVELVTKNSQVQHFFHQPYLPTFTQPPKKPSTSQSPETGYWNPPPDPADFPFTRNTGVKLTPTGPCMDRGNLISLEAPGSDGWFSWGALLVYWRIIPVSQWLITMVRTSPKFGVVPLRNGLKRPKWLMNGGDPNHLTRMILQIAWYSKELGLQLNRLRSGSCEIWWSFLCVNLMRESWYIYIYNHTYMYIMYIYVL